MNPSAKRQWRLWRRAWHSVQEEIVRSWLFVFKACLSVLLTGWIAMRLNLDQPGTAMVTCGIVINPQSGMVLAKSFYRAIGTVIGAAVAITLMGLFLQQRPLLLLGMAFWVGLCAGGATLYRNFKSYGFVLSGYTAAIIILPVLTDGQAPFESMVMRVSEVMLGILIAGIVTDAIAPQRLGKTLRRSVRKQFSDFVDLVRNTLGGTMARSHMEQAHLRFVRAVIDVENLRSSVVFEDAGVRARSPYMRQLNQRFMAATTSYQTLHHLMNRLQKPQDRSPREALLLLFSQVSHAMAKVDRTAHVPVQAEQLARNLRQLRRPLQRTEVAQRQQLPKEQLLDFDTGVELTKRFVRELHAYARAYTQLAGRLEQHHHLTPGEDEFIHGSDWLGATMNMLRTFAVMLITGWFWIVSAWSGGAYAMLIATVFCGLLANYPRPIKVVAIMGKGFSLGGLVAFLFTFGVLIGMDGFVLFAAGLLPILILGFMLFNWPKWAAIGRSSILAFLVLLEPVTWMQFDFTEYLNQYLGFLFGVGMCAAAFMLVVNASQSKFLYRRLLGRLRAEVRRACRGRLDKARHRLESASRDLVVQIIGYTDEGSQASGHLLAWALSVHEMGRAVIQLRQDAKHLNSPLKNRLNIAIDALDKLYDQPSRLHYIQARRGVGHALRMARTHKAWGVLRHLHLLRLALLDRESVLAEYMTPLPAAGHAKELIHAS